MKLRLVEKLILWGMAAILLGTCCYRMWKTWPVYGSPEKQVASYEELKTELESSGRYFVVPEPFWEAGDEPQFNLWLDGRTRYAKVTGYLISYYNEGYGRAVSAVYADVDGQTDLQSDEQPVQSASSAIESGIANSETYRQAYSFCRIGNVRISTSVNISNERLALPDGEEQLSEAKAWTYTMCEKILDGWMQDGN